MSIQFRCISALIFAFAVVGCGKSPLLHHQSGDLQKDSAVLSDHSNCPMEFKALSACASLSWTQAPQGEVGGTFQLRFWDKSSGSEQGPYSALGGDVAVKLWMPSMGHGSSPVKVAPATQEDGHEVPGIYNVSDVFFIMDGKWEVRVRVLREGKELDHSQLSYDVHHGTTGAPIVKPNLPPEKPIETPDDKPPTPEVKTCPIELREQKLCASLTWSKEPQGREDYGAFQIRFWQKDLGSESGPYVDPGAGVDVYFWMQMPKGHGHKSAPPKVSAAKDAGGLVIPGVYDVTQVNFIMEGKWEIWIRLMKGKNELAKVKLNYEAK